MGTAAIVDDRDVSVFAAAIGDSLSISIGFFHHFLHRQWYSGYMLVNNLLCHYQYALIYGQNCIFS